MPDVFRKEKANGMYVELSTGGLMSLDDLVKDYERLLSLGISDGEYVKIDGKNMLLKNLIKDYKRLLRKEASERKEKLKLIPSAEKPISNLNTVSRHSDRSTTKTGGE